MSPAPSEWRCELVDGPDKGKVIFTKTSEPPTTVHPPRHLDPKPGWGGLEDPYHYEPMPFRTYRRISIDLERRTAEYVFKESE